MALDVKLHEILNAGPRQTDLVNRAVRLLKLAVNHRDFGPRVLNSYYRQRRWRSTNRRVVIVPPKDILARVRAGRERATSVDGEIDLRIHLSQIRRGVRGSTNLGNLPIRTAYWFIRECLDADDAASLAGHFMHEWLHVSGFFHYPNNRARQDVPYQVGYIVRDILIAHFGEKDNPAIAKLLEEDDCGCIDDEKDESEPHEASEADNEVM